MNAYSLELTIDAGEKAAKAFRAVKTFDSTVIMGTALQLFRERKPFDVHLDRADRSQILRRLMDLLEELERLSIPYSIVANNAVKSSPFWNPSNWTRAEVASETLEAERLAEETRLAAERRKNYVPPEPPLSRRLLDQRWRDLEFHDLLTSEQNYIRIWAMRAEVNNGGFDTYFDNSDGDDALQTLAALQEVGSTDAHSILSDALQLLETAGGYSPERERRWPVLRRLADNAFIELNTRFYDTSEEVVGMAFRLVEADYKSKGMI